MQQFRADRFVTLSRGLERLRMALDQLHAAQKYSDYLENANGDAVATVEMIVGGSFGNALSKVKERFDASTAKNEIEQKKAKASQINAHETTEAGIKFVLEAMSLELRALGLTFSLSEVDRFRGMKQLPTAIELDGISNRIMDELKDHYFLQINRSHLKYYLSDSPFSKLVAVKFPTMGAFEIDEGAKCIALDRPTACVFHLMRTMEVAINAVAACLSIPSPTRGMDRNWGQILAKIKAAMESRNKTGWSNAADKDWFREAYVSLDAVREAWRNPTMHVEKKHTTTDAEEIFSAVRTFMNKLASRCDEAGQPLA